MDDMSLNTDDTTKWIPSSKSFGARLALVRHGMGWNISEAAEACGIPEGNWREWELKGRNPQKLTEIVDKIAAAALNVDDYWLLTGKPSGIFPDRPTDGLGDFPEKLRSYNLRPVAQLFPVPVLADAA